MTTYKLSTELYDVSFGLIAIHSSLRPYAMAYWLNGSLGIKLSRLEKDFTPNEGIFPVYEWFDEKNDTGYFLYGNKYYDQENLTTTGLFSQETVVRAYNLLEEHKECDYLLRIDSDRPNVTKKIYSQIKEIDAISLSYSIDIETLKSRQNLIL